MKFAAGSLALAAVIPGLVALTINTPSGVTVCEPQLLEWSGGTAPYYISVIPGGDVSASALKTFNSTSATELTWTVDIAAGTSITLRAKDGSGDTAYSGTATVQEGSDTSCVSSSTAVSVVYGSTNTAAEETAADTASTATTTTGTTTTTAADDDSSSTTTTGSTSTSAASSSSSTDNAASALSMNYYFAAIGGVAAVFL